MNADDANLKILINICMNIMYDVGIITVCNNIILTKIVNLSPEEKN